MQTMHMEVTIKRSDRGARTEARNCRIETRNRRTHVKYRLLLLTYSRSIDFEGPKVASAFNQLTLKSL